MQARDWTVTAFPPVHSNITERHRAVRSGIPVSWSRLDSGSAVVTLDVRLGGRLLHVDHVLVRPHADDDVDAVAAAIAADLAAAGAVRA